MLLMCVVSWALLVAFVLLLCVACCLLADCRCSVLLAVGCVFFVLGCVGSVLIVACGLSWSVSCLQCLAFRARCVLARSTFGVVIIRVCCVLFVASGLLFVVVWLLLNVV